jgi:hypothetical protein
MREMTVKTMTLQEANRIAQKRISELEAENERQVYHLKQLTGHVQNLLSGMESYPPSLDQKWLVDTDDITALAEWIRADTGEEV